MVNFRLAAFVLTSLVLSACSGGFSERRACLEPRSSVSLAQFMAGERVGDDALNSQIEGCSLYIDSLEPQQYSQLGHALLKRSKAYILTGDTTAALADISKAERLAAFLKTDQSLVFRRGAGNSLRALRALAEYQSGDKALGRQQAYSLADEFPYLESLQGLALAVALENKDFSKASEYSALSYKISPNEQNLETYGHLLELAARDEEAMRLYSSMPKSGHGQLRLAHLYLAKDDILSAESALTSVDEVLANSEVTSEQQTLVNMLINQAEVNKLKRKQLRQRLIVARAMIELAKRPNPDALKTILAGSTDLAHYEVLAALQFAKRVQPKLVSVPVPEEPAGPKLAEESTVKRLLKSSVSRLTDQFIRRPSNSMGYSASIPLIKTVGYRDEVLSDSERLVRFDSLSEDKAFVLEMILLRSAELAREAGHNSFNIVNAQHFNKVMTINGTSTGTVTGYFTQFKIKFSDQNGELNCCLFNVQKVVQSLSPVYRK